MQSFRSGGGSQAAPCDERVMFRSVICLSRPRRTSAVASAAYRYNWRGDRYVTPLAWAQLVCGGQRSPRAMLVPVALYVAFNGCRPELGACFLRRSHYGRSAAAISDRARRYNQPAGGAICKTVLPARGSESERVRRGLRPRSCSLHFRLSQLIQTVLFLPK